MMGFKAFGKAKVAERKKVAAERKVATDSDPYLKLGEILRTLDQGNGVEFNDLVTELSKTQDVDINKVEDMLFELAYEGKVYQPRPEAYRLMD